MGLKYSEFLNLLNECKNDQIFLKNNLDENNYIVNNSQQVNQLLNGVDQYVIDSYGQINSKTVLDLNRLGFNVTVTEQDSFGPLAAEIVCNEFKLSFG